MSQFKPRKYIAPKTAARPAVKSSWEKVGKWYSGLVGDEGHYYHRTVVLPGVLKLLKLKESAHSRLLDVGCGEGVLARVLPEEVAYCGIDASKMLIEAAKDKNMRNAIFKIADATKPFPVEKNHFSHATIILALQNMPHPEKVFKNIAASLNKKGRLVIVLNHPCFRVMRGSDWSVDRDAMVQYRRISNYMGEKRISIQLNPSKGELSKVTYSYHYPLTTLFKALAESGFVIDALEEWCSDKKSTGKMARVEDFARDEIPLFMAISAIKSSEE